MSRDAGLIARAFEEAPLWREPREFGRNESVVHIAPERAQLLALRVAKFIQDQILEEARINRNIEVEPDLCPGCTMILMVDTFAMLGRMNNFDHIQMGKQLGAALLGDRTRESLR